MYTYRSIVLMLFLSSTCYINIFSLFGSVKVLADSNVEKKKLQEEKKQKTDSKTQEEKKSEDSPKKETEENKASEPVSESDPEEVQETDPEYIDSITKVSYRVPGLIGP